MNRFTIFTIILVSSVIVVAGDLAVREYVDTKSSASVLTIPPPLPADPAPPNPVVPPTPVTTPVAMPSAAPAPTPAPPAPFQTTLTPSVAAQAGFTAALEESHFDGKVFKLLDISKFPVQSIALYELMEGDGPIAAVTEIALPDEIAALQLYLLLQNKTKPYIDLSLNETNAYGDRSFYINHAKKPDEAFLTVKIGKVIYTFAYLKLYHPQIKELIKLLTS